MNVYRIGRDTEVSDIIIDDPSNTISRTHAVFKIGKNGKYTITDCSSNGTYVNGIRISSGVETPVKRNDIISFAHMIDFDWSMIPDQRGKTLKIILWSILGVLVATMIAVSILLLSKKEGTQDSIPVEEPTEVIDTMKIREQAPLKSVEEPAPVKQVKPATKKDAPKKEPEVKAEPEPEPEITNPIL